MTPFRRVSAATLALSLAIAISACGASPPAAPDLEVESATIEGSFVPSSDASAFGPLEIVGDDLDALGEALSVPTEQQENEECGAGFDFTLDWEDAAGASDRLEVHSCGARGRDAALVDWARDYLDAHGYAGP